ncbi:hypothetical protein GCM10010470_32660 [Saccharopolyspora taberi]|uniref:Uncharacterized protein n=2 Tax=Saccharopolyspora taberi TaxID=60895 RepID=A0ABN3VF48_9PSEU
MNAELAKVVELLRSMDAVLVNVGHGRGERSTADADAFVRAWADGGGELGTVVSWPATAASWLRPACRFAAGAPDAWVVAAEPGEWTGIGPRLAATGLWRPHRTVAFSGLAGLADGVDGLRGATEDGAGWMFFDGQLVVG